MMMVLIAAQVTTTLLALLSTQLHHAEMLTAEAVLKAIVRTPASLE
jgi:hypothetical protein